MILVKHIFVLTIMIAFTFNATVGFAADMCGNDHHEPQIMETPCHDGEAAELEIEPDDSKQEREQATCKFCECGHCKTHSQVLLEYNAASPDARFGQSNLSAHHKEVITPLIIYGIDNPPKQIS